jgi:hypothetical protein
MYSSQLKGALTASLKAFTRLWFHRRAQALNEHRGARALDVVMAGG